MSATEEFPHGSGEQTDTSSGSSGGGRDRGGRLHVQRWETAFWMEGSAGAKAGEQTACGEKARRQRAAAGGALEGQQQPAEASALLSLVRGITLGREHLE